MVGKKSELSVIKWPRKQLFNIVATLWQRLDNVGQQLCHNVGDRRRHNFHFRPYDNVVITSTTTLWQRCHNVAVPVRNLLLERYASKQISNYILESSDTYIVGNAVLNVSHIASARHLLLLMCRIHGNQNRIWQCRISKRYSTASGWKSITLCLVPSLENNCCNFFD